MAKKEVILQKDIDSLVKLFLSGCGSHLGVMSWRPLFIKNEGLYKLTEQRFTYLLNQSWSVNELTDYLKEAKSSKRLVSKPDDLVEGRYPKAKQKDSERNLLEYHKKETLYFHPAIKLRSMPCVELDNTGKVLSTTCVSSGNSGEYIESFTLGDLVTYWKSRIGDIEAEEAYGALEWFIARYPLPTILYGIDSLAESLKNERDGEVRKRIGIFDLKSFITTIELEQKEILKWI